LVEGWAEVGNERADSTHDLGEVQTRLDNQVGIISELFSGGEASADVNWARLAFWLWNTAVVADWGDGSEDILKVLADDWVSFLSLDIVNEGLKSWNQLGDTGDATEDISWDGFIKEFSAIVALEKSEFIRVFSENRLKDAGSVESLGGFLEVVDQVNEGVRVVGLVGQRSEHASNAVDALQALLGTVGGEDGVVHAVLGNELRSWDEGFKNFLKSDPITGLVAGVKRLKSWKGGEEAELAHVLSRDNGHGDEKGKNDFVHFEF